MLDAFEARDYKSRFYRGVVSQIEVNGVIKIEGIRTAEEAVESYKYYKRLYKDDNVVIKTYTIDTRAFPQYWE